MGHSQICGQYGLKESINSLNTSFTTQKPAPQTLAAQHERMKVGLLLIFQVTNPDGQDDVFFGFIIPSEYSELGETEVCCSESTVLGASYVSIDSIKYSPDMTLSVGACVRYISMTVMYEICVFMCFSRLYFDHQVCWNG